MNLNLNQIDNPERTLESLKEDVKRARKKFKDNEFCFTISTIESLINKIEQLETNTKLFIPTHLLKNGKWEKINKQGKDWLKDELWKSNVSYITKVSEDIVVVEYCSGEHPEGVYKGTYKGTITL